MLMMTSLLRSLWPRVSRMLFRLCAVGERSGEGVREAAQTTSSSAPVGESDGSNEADGDTCSSALHRTVWNSLQLTHA